MQLLGKQRSARDGSGAPTAQKTRLGDAAIFDASGELKDITTNRVADFNAGVCAGKFAGVARIAKVIQ